MRRHIISVLQAIAVTGSLLVGAASSAQDDPVAATHREAMTHYANGRVSQAIATLEKSLPSPRNEARLQGRLPSVTLLMDVCTRATEWDCLAKWALPALTLTLNMPAENELQRVEWQRQAGYYYAVLAAIQGHRKLRGRVFRRAWRRYAMIHWWPTNTLIDSSWQPICT